jgi:hypothetical protein
MTYFLNFRSKAVGGSIVEPYLLQGDATVSPVALRAVDWIELGPLTAGRNVIFAVHGFNVSYEHGARSLAQLETRLNLTRQDLFLGVLWPGDYWLPVINYPFEGNDANNCGQRLAAFSARWLAGAQSISFLSHSLGARLVLEAVRHLARPARMLCLTAAAIDRDCLTTEYASVTGNAQQISLLASHNDWVLKVAFRIGDPISDLLRDQPISAKRALGYNGPPTPAPSPVSGPWQIPDAEDYGHGSYLPPGDTVQAPPVAAAAQWARVAEFMARAFRGLPQSWP